MTPDLYRPHAHASKFARQHLHKLVTHPRPSSVRQHQEPARLRRPRQQRRHLASTLHSESQPFARRHFAAILAEHLIYKSSPIPLELSHKVTSRGLRGTCPVYPLIRHVDYFRFARHPGPVRSMAKKYSDHQVGNTSYDERNRPDKVYINPGLPQEV